MPPLKHEDITLEAGPFHLHADVFHGGEQAQVLLLHGLGGNSITWHGVAPILARELRARVLAVDLPGFGASRAGRCTVDMVALGDVVTTILDRQSPPGARWQLAGNSLGGVLALEAACRRPDRVAGVTLASVALPLAWGRRASEMLALGPYVPMALPWLGRRLVSRYMRRTGVPGLVDEPIEMLFRDPSRLDSDLRQRLIDVTAYRLTWTDEASRALEETTRSLGASLLWPGQVARWIREVSRPVLAIHGSHDPLYPLTAWERLQRTRPDWEYVTLDDVGHVPQLEAPQRFARHLLRRWSGDLAP